MKTLIINSVDSSATQTAAEILRCGGLVAVPTETVYGLAAMATNAAAVEKIYDVKGRPETKPISLLVASMEQAEKLCVNIPEAAYALADAFWPGPLTMILKKAPCVPDIVTAGGDTVGVRSPDHTATLDIIRTTGEALAAPSANFSGQPSPVNADEVLEYFDGSIECVIDGGTCNVGVASTIVDLTVKPARILRQGGLEEEQICAVLALYGY